MGRKVTPKVGAPSGGLKLLYVAQCDDCKRGVAHTLHGPQVRLMESPAQEILYGGAAGGGKSYALRMLAVNYCLQYKNARVVLFRRTYAELEDTHISMLQQELPSYIASYSVGNHEFRFKDTGSVLMMRYCEKEEDVYSYDTFEADLMLFDELTAFSEFQYVYLMTRCRSTKPWWPGRKIISATNPGNVGHTWVKRRFIDYCEPYTPRTAPDDEGGLVRQFIPAKISDNPALRETDPDYIKAIEALKGAGHEELYRAKALGDWNVFTGQFFARWRDQVHVVDPFSIPADWARYICVDWGIYSPHAVYWVARPPQTHTLYVYREQYGAGVATIEQARMAYERTVAAQEKIQFLVADPSMWAKEKDAHGALLLSNISYWEDLFRGTCEVVKGNNERVMGASMFREVLDWQGVEDEAGIRVITQPKLFFMRNCEHAISTIPSLVHSKTNPEDVDTNGEDHCLAGWTPVLTQHGWQPIQELAGAKITGYNTVVVDITVATGETITCTLNHRFLTSTGWKEARSLRVGSMILWSSAQPFRSTRGNATTSAVATFNTKENAYIVGSGSTTTGQSLVAGMSTTQTTIKGTTLEGISVSSWERRISPIILPVSESRMHSVLHGERTLLAPVEWAIHDLLRSSGENPVVKVGKPYLLDAVWDITLTEEPHAFVASGGFVVHNSYDSLRYLIRAVFQAPEKKQQPRYILDNGGAIRVVAA